MRSIVLLITQGQSRKEIAAQLGSSKHTIDWHLRRLYRDLGVRSMAEIVRLETLTTLALQDAPPLNRGMAKGRHDESFWMRRSRVFGIA